VGDCLDKLLSEGKGYPEELISAAERLGNGAIFKRLEFLAERRGGPEELIAAFRERLTTGNSRLDPAVASRRLVKRWRLWIPPSWVEANTTTQIYDKRRRAPLRSVREQEDRTAVHRSRLWGANSNN
jgi:hypothetical protein